MGVGLGVGVGIDVGTGVGVGVAVGIGVKVGTAVCSTTGTSAVGVDTGTEACGFSLSINALTPDIDITTITIPRNRLSNLCFLKKLNELGGYETVGAARILDPQ